MSLPQWVPAPVAAMSAVWQSEISQRLITDARMEEVWSLLRMKDVNSQAYNSLPPHDRPEEFGVEIEKCCLADFACGALHNIALREFTQNFVLPRTQITKWVKEWKDVSLWCRLAWQIDGAPLGDPALKAALDRVAEHFEQLAVDYPQKTKGARILGKQCKTKGKRLSKEKQFLENVRRAQVTAFIEKGDALFRGISPKTLSAFCAVALGCEITPKQIERWRLALSRSL